MIQRKIVGISIGALLGAAAIQNYLVAERIVGAGWQWYKFWGYGNDGHITLGWSTAIVFYAVSVVTLILSVVCAREWAPESRLERIYGWMPTFLISIGTIAYTTLAWSPLNIWRP